MLYPALAFIFSMMLTFFLGGLIGLFIRFMLALLFLPLIAFFRNKNATNTVINSGPWILTIEFLANIFYGWFANYIGVWVFQSMDVRIDWFYPILVLFSFIWFDVNRIQREQKRIKAMGKSNLNESLPIELINQDMNKLRLGNFLSDHLNSRYTVLFGKITGVIIGGYNLIFSLN